jgi:hypothetical protein
VLGVDRPHQRIAVPACRHDLDPVGSGDHMVQAWRTRQLSSAITTRIAASPCASPSLTVADRRK